MRQHKHSCEEELFVITVDEVEQFLYVLLKEKMNMPVERDRIAPGTLLGSGGLELESLAIVEMAIHLEGRFHTPVPDEDLDRISRLNVGELADYLNGKTAAV
jgi:acyl carrier protein